jgi:LysM repeat protein
VQKDDTLQGIAKAAYGDASYWYAIAEANGLADSSSLQAGQALVLPSAQSIGAGSTNSASTIKPNWWPLNRRWEERR